MLLILHFLIYFLDSDNIRPYYRCLHYILIVDSNDQGIPLPLLFNLLIHFDILLNCSLATYSTHTLFDIVNDCESVFLMICNKQVVKELLV